MMTSAHYDDVPTEFEARILLGTRRPFQKGSTRQVKDTIVGGR